MNLRTVPSAELLGVGSVGVATGAQEMFIPQYALPVGRHVPKSLLVRTLNKSSMLQTLHEVPRKGFEQLESRLHNRPFCSPLGMAVVANGCVHRAKAVIILRPNTQQKRELKIFTIQRRIKQKQLETGFGYC